MKLRKLLYQTGLFLLDLVELYIPILTFIAMFVAFLLTIFFRYFLRSPLGWGMEAQIAAFIWTALLSAAYTRRKRAHVKFTLVYDKLSERGQAWMRIAENLIIGAVFAVVLHPTYDYIQFMAFQRTTRLRIPFNYVYFPFVVMMLLVIGHCLYDIVMDIRRLRRGEV